MNVFKKRDQSELVVIVLRFAVGAVFLWFGIDKWVHPEAWDPAWLSSRLPVSPDTLLWIAGAFEFSLGVLFVGGRLLRPASAVAGLFLLAIALILGASEVTVRDNALIGCCLALFLLENAKAKKPLPADKVSLICSLYVIFLFVYGALYLRV